MLEGITCQWFMKVFPAALSDLIEPRTPKFCQHKRLDPLISRFAEHFLSVFAMHLDIIHRQIVMVKLLVHSFQSCNTTEQRVHST